MCGNVKETYRSKTEKAGKIGKQFLDMFTLISELQSILHCDIIEPLCDVMYAVK